FVQPRALGRKASDEFAVPLCRSHHRAVHRGGDEKAWWKQAGIDPIKVARKLWKHTRIDEGRIEPEPTAQRASADRPATKRRASARSICSGPWRSARGCFTPPPAPHLPISWSTATEKPGPSAANGFGAGCGAAITRRPEAPRAGRRFAQRSIYSRR